ncbi:MAG: small basic protein [Planctomycetota bacterium]|jgi:small basic protein (TIGR04137 family)|nr:small basic protein [Planctomycetota bacterium]MDP6763313.1 small basic protein [Planctomycetota bacterium]MDP6989467.1 small basic protein [Planctomycetota bacterium]
MSIHPSLRGADSLVGERSVLKRIERLQKLQDSGKFDAESDSVYGLPKVRTKFKVAKKKAEAAEEGGDDAAGEAPADGETEAAAE